MANLSILRRLSHPNKPSTATEQSRLRRGAIAFAAAILLVSSSSALALPSQFSARYEVAHLGLTLGEAVVRYEELPGARYRYSSVTRPMGLASLFFSTNVREHSEGSITTEGFRPDSYRYDRSGKGKRKAQLSFDWNKKEVTNDVAGKTWRMQVPDSAKDRMVTLLQLMHDLAQRGQEQQLTYNVADGGKLKTYTVKILGQEDIKTPYGTFETIKIIEKRDDKDKATTMWVAPKLDYLAVRIDHRDNDDRYRMTLEELSGFDVELKPSATDVNGLQLGGT